MMTVYKIKEDNRTCIQPYMHIQKFLQYFMDGFEVFARVLLHMQS